MNEDLEAIEREIEERKQLQVVNTTTAPAIPFNKAEESAPATKDQATQLVESAFNQAIVNRVVENEEVQQELLESADKVIDNKVQAIVAKAEQESKEAHFNNKKNACDCFGYNEATTEKWQVNLMNLWHNVMSAIWIVIGFFTFAPITFIAKKIVVIFKKAWIAFLLAAIIYLAVTLVPILTGLLIK